MEEAEEEEEVEEEATAVREVKKEEEVKEPEWRRESDRRRRLTVVFRLRSVAPAYFVIVILIGGCSSFYRSPTT